MTYWPEAGKTIKEETQALRMFERKIERKIYGPKYMDERWRVRTNKEIKDILQRTDIVKLIKIPPTKMVWSCYKYVTLTNTRIICNSYNGKDREERKTT